ncbi:MAG: hypothetical protein JRE64_14905 [Deltaproteobacteria bacterium]|nr:hypothetical protein [Deltaproteobacteria bacterium]
MLSVITNFILEVLNPIGIVFSIILSIPVLWTWYEVALGRKRRQKRLIEGISNSPGTRPAILVVDLKENTNIWAQVEQSRQRNDLLKQVPDDRIVRIKYNIWLKPDDMVGFVEKLREKLGKVAELGADVLYLIYAGPVTPAAIIGAELANSCRVILFQHQQGQYINWGTLKHNEN